MPDKTEFLNILRERGFLHQASDAEATQRSLTAGVVTGYIGFDATAASLHAGHISQIMMLRWLQLCGHRPIVLIGGGTSMIGDPSFKDTARRMMDDTEIDTNKAGISGIFSRFVYFDPLRADTGLMIDNADWLLGLNYLQFLREAGRHISVNRMLSFDSVKSRLDRDHPLTFLEFNYMVLQAYDFVELHRRFGCTLQMGGSDQWGNIVGGIELGRKMDGAELHAVTSPLLQAAGGQKMGKTGDSPVWLDAAMTSPYEFWQYWRNVHDDDVVRFLKLFTELPLDEIDRFSGIRGSELNEAKIRLADSVTSLVHGDEAAGDAFETSKAVFSGGTSQNMPRISLSLQETGGSMSLVDVCLASGFATSKSDARRKIAEKGIRVDGIVADDPEMKISLSEGGSIKLSFGRKKHVLVEAVAP